MIMRDLRNRYWAASLCALLLAVFVAAPTVRGASADQGQVKALANKGAELAEQGQNAEAIRYYERAVELAPGVYGPRHRETGRLMNELALLYVNTGRYAQGGALHRKALAIYEDALGKNHLEVATVLCNVAWAEWQVGRYGDAEPLAARCLKIRESELGKDHAQVADALNLLGFLYHEMGQYDKAEPLLQRGLEINEAGLGRDHLNVAESLFHLGELYRSMKQYTKAEDYLQRSLQIRQAKLEADHPVVAAALTSLGWLYTDMGQYAKAEPVFLRGLHIQEAKLGKDHPIVAITLSNLAALYLRMKQPAKAEPLFLRSLAIIEAKLGKDHPDVALRTHNLGNLYLSLGQLDKAEHFYRRTLQIRQDKLGKDHPYVGGILSTLAKLYAGTGAWQQAAERFEQSRRNARQHIRRVLPILSEKEQLTFLNSEDRFRLHTCLSFGLLRRDDASVAAESAAWLLNGKAILQQTLAERALLARDHSTPELGRVSEELSTVRKRLAALSLSRAKPGEEESRLQEWQQLTEHEQRLARQVNQARGGSARDETWVELNEVRKTLPANGILVEIARFTVVDFETAGKQKKAQTIHYAAWVIPAAGPGTVQVIDLGPAEPIEAVVQAVRQALRDAPQVIRRLGEPEAEKALRELLGVLSRLILQPLLPQIEDRTTWVLSPDSALWLVPWAALPLKDGDYAAQKHRIHYVISGRDLLAAGARGGLGRPLVMADPDYDLLPSESRVEARAVLAGQNLALADNLRSTGLVNGLPAVRRLPGTAVEAAAIIPRLETYAGQKLQVYTDKQALEAVFKAARRPRVLVLSTHGYFLEDQPSPSTQRPTAQGKRSAAAGLSSANPLLRCGLLLAGCNKRGQAQDEDEDGVLTGLEVVGTDLRGTELVVLSACETGLGEVRNGEGVAGLRQAFQLAGAQSVLATLWQIPDRETTQIMGGFFEKLAAGKGKADALHCAQLALIEDRRGRNGAAHPFFWAAFTITGSLDPKPGEDGPLAADPRSERLGSAEAYNERGEAFLGEGRYTLALADFQAALRLDPKSARAHNNIGMVHQSREEYAQAVGAFDKAIALESGNANFYRNRGIVNRLRGERTQAIADFDRALERNDKDEMSYLSRAQCHVDLGQPDRAIADCNRVLELNPKSALAYRRHGWANYRKKNVDQALADYKQAVKLDPNNAYLYNDRGAAHEQRQNYDQALADYTQALQLKPAYATTYLNRANLYRSRKQYKQAVADYEVAATIAPRYRLSAVGYINRGEAYRMNGQHEKAIVDFEAALKLEPNSARAYANRGYSYKNLNEYERALADFNQALKRSPKYAFALVGRGGTYRLQGDFAAALTDLDEAIRLAPKYTDAYRHRALTYRARADEAKARADEEKARQLDSPR
jgi:tetratricopeptide (TPR) repeat protein